MGKWSTYRRRGTAGSDAVVSAWLSRVQANGGTASNGTIDAVNTLYLSLVSAGLWDRMFDVWPCCGDQLAAARAKLKVATGTASSYTAVAFVNGDYVESGGSGGLTGNGSTKWLTGGCTGTQLALDCHLFASAKAFTATAGNNPLCGVLNGTDQWWIGGLVGTSNCIARLGAGVTATQASAMTAGYFIGSRTASNALALYRAGVSVATAAGATTVSAEANQVMLFAYNSSGSAGAQTAQTLNGHTSGLGLTAAQAASLTTIWTAFNTALGR